jgi:hypothetical protein
VGDVAHGVEPADQAGGALDRVRGAEQGVEELVVARALLQGDEGLLHLREGLLRLLQEGLQERLAIDPQLVLACHVRPSTGPRAPQSWRTQAVPSSAR